MTNTSCAGPASYAHQTGPSPDPGLRRPVIRQTLNGPVVVDDPGLIVAVRRQAGPDTAADPDRVTLGQAIDRLTAAVKRNDDVVLELYQRLESVLAADDPRKCDDEAGKASTSISRPCSVVLRLMVLIAELDQSFGRCLELGRRLEL